MKNNFCKKGSWTHAPFGNTLNMLHFTVLGLALASFVYWWYYVYEMGLLRMTSRHAKHMNSPMFYNDIVVRIIFCSENNFD